MNTNPPAGSATGTDLDGFINEMAVRHLGQPSTTELRRMVRECIAEAARRAPQPSADRAPADGAGEQQCWSDSVPCKKCGKTGWHVCAPTAGDSTSPQPSDADVALELARRWKERALQAEAALAIPQPGVDEAGERALFEDFYKFGARKLERETDPDFAHRYANDDVQAKWEGWQDRAALTRRAPPADLSATSMQPLCSDGAIKSGQEGAAQTPLGVCCYGGPLKPKSACASCAAWQPSREGNQGAAQAQAGDAVRDQMWRPLLSAVLREFPRRMGRGANGNAPGHCHSRPGIWDDDNGALAGKECAWCIAWNAAAQALADEGVAMAAPAQRNGGEQ